MSEAPLSIAELAAGFLSAEAEIEALTRQWSALETEALNGSRAASAQMAAIDLRLRQQDASRQENLEAIAASSAGTLPDVAAKLAVAACELSGEGGLVHDIIADAATALRVQLGDAPDAIRL